MKKLTAADRTHLGKVFMEHLEEAAGEEILDDLAFDDHQAAIVKAALDLGISLRSRYMHRTF